MSSQPLCYRHPDRLAVEQCETCQRPVCGSCLWYAEGGQRLCPDHAAEALQAGQTVTPPERYAEGIHHSQQDAARAVGPQVPYKGNSTDVTALAAMLAGVGAIAACAGLTWLFPILAFVLGLVAWLQARDALDPRRTRWMGAVGMAGGGLFLVGVLGMVLMCSLCFMLQVALATPGPRILPTPTPFIFVTPTP